MTTSGINFWHMFHLLNMEFEMCILARQGLHAMHSTATVEWGNKHELTYSANAWGQRTWCNGYIGGFDEKWQN